MKNTIIYSILNKLGAFNLTHPVVFEIKLFYREGEVLFFEVFSIIINHIFWENAIEIPKVVQNIWKLSLLILTIFIVFSDFLLFPCFKETNYVSIQKIILAFTNFKSTIYRLFNNCITFYWYQISSFWNMKGGLKWPPPPPKNNYSHKSQPY